MLTLARTDTGIGAGQPLATGLSQDSEPRQYEQLTLPLEGIGEQPPLIDACQVSVRASRAAAQVAAFHRSFGLPWQRRPNVHDVPANLLRLRETLLEEETAEFVVASHRRDLVGMADALADVVYVAYGTALTLGVDLDALLDEVHRSNMSKLDARGRPVLRDDGKVLKSPRYHAPDIEARLAHQPSLPY